MDKEKGIGTAPTDPEFFSFFKKKKFRRTLYMLPFFFCLHLKLFRTETEEVWKGYLRLFLLPSGACNTPDKGKKLRYPHTFERSGRLYLFE